MPTRADLRFLATWLLLLMAITAAISGCRGRDSAERTAVQSASPVAFSQATEAPDETEVALVQTPGPTPLPTAPLAAFVNGASIYLADYERQVAAFEQALVAEGLDPDSEEGQAALEQIRYDVLESMIDVALIQQGGLELAVTLSDEEIRTQIAADVADGGGEANFEAWLAETGQTRDEYTALVAQSLYAQKVMEKVGAEIPSEAEQVHVRQIIVDTDAAAREVLAKLQDGADFPDVARERSLDLTTAEGGGDLGWLPRGVLSPQLEEVAFSLQPGEVSKPIDTGDGYNILQVVDREASRPLEPEIKMQLTLTVFEEWLQALRDGAEIRRLVGE